MAKKSKSKVTGYSKGMLNDPDPRYQIPGTYRYAKNIKLINSDGLTFTVENINGNTKVIDLYEEFKDDGNNITFYPEVPNIWQQHTDANGDPEHSSTGTKLNFAGNIVGHFSFKNQLFLIIVGYMNGNLETEIDHDEHKNVRWRTQFAILDFDNNGNVVSAKDLFVCWNAVGLSYPDLNMDPLLSCRVEGLVENDCLTRVYWTDNLNPLRTIQLNRTDLPDVDPKELDIKPMARFNEPVLTSVTSGRLLAGVYRYAYKYETNDGGETGISGLSDVYHTTFHAAGTYYGYYGSESGVETNQGFKVTVHNVDQDFDKITLYACYYTGLNSAPIVARVATEQIQGSGPNESVDFYHAALDNQIPNGLAEVLIPSNTWDVCKDITIKDNILFAANLRSIQNIVTEKEWNVKIRRSALDTMNQVTLTTTDSSVKDWKCTTPYDPDNVVDAGSNKNYNKLDLSASYNSHRTAHRYVPNFPASSVTSPVLGGASHSYDTNALGGCRVTFKMAPKTASDVGNKGKINSTLRYGTSASIDSYASEVHQMDNVSGNSFNNVDTIYKATVSGIGANKDPMGAGARRGYQRGETYRFGVLTYDKAGNPGNVLWIGDIQMPVRHDQYISVNHENNTYDVLTDSDLQYNCESMVQDFRTSCDISNHIPMHGTAHEGFTAGSQWSDWNTQINGPGFDPKRKPYKPLGNSKGKIYTFDLFPVFEFWIPEHVREKISAFQVVRAERKEQDRTIVQQGILKQCNRYAGYANSSVSVDGESRDFSLTNTQLSANTAGVGNDWPEYELLLNYKIGINCTNMGIEGSGANAHSQAGLTNGTVNVGLRRDAFVGDNQADFSSSQYFGSFDYGWWFYQVNNSGNNQYRYQHFVDPTTHVMYSPDSAFGVRPYQFRTGDAIVIDACMILSDRARWIMDHSYDAAENNVDDGVFFNRHVIFDPVGNFGYPVQFGPTSTFNIPTVDGAAFGWSHRDSYDAHWFSTLRLKDKSEGAWAALGFFTEYDTYFNNYLQHYNQKESTGNTRKLYVSRTDGRNNLDTHTIDIGQNVGGPIGGTNQTDPFVSAAYHNALTSTSASCQAASSYIYQLGNAKEIADGEIVGEDFFSHMDGISSSSWRYALYFGGFSNHSLGFAHLGSGNSVQGAQPTQSYSGLCAGSANTDLTGDDVCTDTVSQLHRGTRGILLSLGYSGYSGTNIENYGATIGNRLRSGHHNVRDIVGIISNQYWSQGNMLTMPGGGRQYKIPYASLASIVRPNNLQYGGDSLGAIEETVYIQAGHIHPLIDSGGAPGYHVSRVFGGDTFVGMYSHQTTIAPDPQNSIAKWEIFPVESYVNTDMRSGLHLAAGQTEEGHDQAVPPYSNDWFYNPVYSQEKNLKRYMSIKENECDVINLPYQIAYSQTKVSGEKKDAFRIFPLYNFHDVEALYGEITSIVTHKNDVYFTQEKALAKLIVNPRTFLSDAAGSSIFTGTGETVQAHEYKTVEYGTRHINSVVQSESNLYFFDVDREKIISYDGNRVKVLSDEKGLKNDLNKYLKYGRLKIYDKYDEFNRISRNDMPLNFIGIHGVFDYKTRNLIYTILDGIRIDKVDREAYPTGPNVYESNSGTPTLAINPWDNGNQFGGYAERFRLHNSIVYNEEIDAFISYLSVYPPFWIHHNGYTYSPRIRMRFNGWIVSPDSYPHFAAYGTGYYIMGNEDLWGDGVDDWVKNRWQWGTHHLKEGALELWKWEGNEDVKNWFYEDTLYNAQVDSQLSQGRFADPNADSFHSNRYIHKSTFEVVVNDFPLDNKKFDNVQIISTSKTSDGVNYFKEINNLIGKWEDLDSDPATPNVLTERPVFDSMDFYTDYTDKYVQEFEMETGTMHKYREGSFRLPIRSNVLLDDGDPPQPINRYRQTGTYMVARLHSYTDKKFNIFAITTKFRKSFN